MYQVSLVTYLYGFSSATSSTNAEVKDQLLRANNRFAKCENDLSSDTHTSLYRADEEISVTVADLRNRANT